MNNTTQNATNNSGDSYYYYYYGPDECDDFDIGLPTKQLEYMLIAASVVIIVCCFFVRRRRLLPGFLRGYPGLPVPIDSLGWPRQRKGILLAALSATASCVGLIAGPWLRSAEFQHFENIYLNRLVRPFIIALFIGLFYYPVFAGVHYSFAIPGCLLGGAYTLSILVVRIVYVEMCVRQHNYRAWWVTTGSIVSVPEFVGLLALLVFFAYRFWKCFRKTNCRHPSTAANHNKYYKWDNQTLNQSESSWEWRYVRKLLQKDLSSPEKEESCPKRSKTQAMRHRLINALKKVYDREDPFRFSARVLIPAVISTTSLFFVTIYLTGWLFYTFYDEELWLESRSGGDIAFLPFLLDIVKLLRAAAMISLQAAFLLGLWHNMSILSAHKKNLKLVYRGMHPVLNTPKRKLGKQTNSRLNQFSKYTGYQTAYLLSAFFVTFLAVVFVIIVIGVVYLIGKYYSWIYVWNKVAGPIVSFALFLLVFILSSLLMKYCFTDHTQHGMVFKNVRALHNFNYFMIFYRLIMGFFSALLRNLISAGIALLHLPRLDRSLMMEGFSRFDRGYMTYLGFVSVEGELTNPTVFVFTNLLLQTQEEADDLSWDASSTALQTSSSRSARNRWLVAYTLLRNPSLIAERRSDVIIEAEPPTTQDVSLTINIADNDEELIEAV